MGGRYRLRMSRVGGFRLRSVTLTAPGCPRSLGLCLHRAPTCSQTDTRSRQSTAEPFPLAFGLGDETAAAKALMIRHMLQRGFLMSSQLYVTWPHREEIIAHMLDALDASLAEVAKTQERGALKAESGVGHVQQGFARLV